MTRKIIVSRCIYMHARAHTHTGPLEPCTTESIIHQVCNLSVSIHIYVEWLSAACCTHVCACVWSFVAIGISPSSRCRRLVKTKLPLSSDWWAAVGWIPASPTAGGLTFMCAASAADAQVMLQQRRTTAAAVHSQTFHRELHSSCGSL